MSNLEFLEISRNFKSYYRTLRDVHYYLTNDSELNKEELKAVTKVLSKLIYGFIRIKGTSFREMDREQFEQEFNLFHQDFLNIIQNSGENNVEFDQFSALIDEIIGIAVKRTIALGKIKKLKQKLVQEEEEIADVTDAESEVSFEEKDHDTEDDVVKDVFGGIGDIKEAVPVIETLRNEVRNFSTDALSLSNKVRNFSTEALTLSNEVESIGNEVRNYSTDDLTLTNEFEVVLYEIENAENKQPELDHEAVVEDVINEVKEVEAAADTPKKVKNNYVDAAPIYINLTDIESSDNVHFRPRRRKR
jgi:hypothetical protein